MQSSMKSFIAVYLLLTTAVIAASRSKTLSRTTNPQIEIPDRKSKLFFFQRDYDLAPEILDDRSFAIGLYVFNSSDVLSGLSLQLVGSEISGKCLMPFEPAGRITFWPVRRLSYKTALISIEDNLRLKLVIVNFLSCKYEEVYDAALPKQLHIFTSNNSSDERFSIIMYGKESCRGHNWCRLYFDPLYQKFESLAFNFLWNELVEIKPTTSFDGNHFIIRLTDATNTHRIRLYDLSTFKYKEFYSVMSDDDDDLRVRSSSDTPYYNRNVRLKARFSNLSYCWTPERFNEFKTIHCSKFLEDGTITFNQTLVYPDFMILLDVETIQNGFILFARERDCLSNPMRNCSSIVQFAIVTRKFECIDDSNCSDKNSKSIPLIGNELIQIKHRRLKLECHALNVGVFKVRMNESDGSVEVEYLCDCVNFVSYHTFTLL